MNSRARSVSGRLATIELSPAAGTRSFVAIMVLLPKRFDPAIGPDPDVEGWSLRVIRSIDDDLERRALFCKVEQVNEAGVLRAVRSCDNEAGAIVATVEFD